MLENMILASMWLIPLFIIGAMDKRLRFCAWIGLLILYFNACAVVGYDYSYSGGWFMFLAAIFLVPRTDRNPYADSTQLRMPKP